MSTMNKRQRLEAAVCAGEVDRPPVALWRHFPGDDQRAEDQALAHLTFQRQHDFDFIKVTPNSSYCVEDWGVQSEYVGNTEGTREYRRYVIHEPADWARLSRLDLRQGALARQIRCLQLISQEVGVEVPFIQTIFNPLSVAKYLAGDEQMRIHLRRHPEALRAGLEIIAETSARLVREVMRSGAAGIFFAVQHAQFGLLAPSEYAEFGRPYDLQVLAATEGAWFNLLHLHGNEVMFDLLADYPVQAINWHDRETPPTLAQALERFPGAVCGGLRQWETLVRGTPDDVRTEAADAINQTRGRRFILGTGCVTPIVAPIANIRAARSVVQELR